MKKAISIFKAAFVWLPVLSAAAMMLFTLVSVRTFDRNDRSIFGHKAYIVLTDSMATTDGDAGKGYFSAGDLVLVKETDPQTLVAGDIISYISTNADNFGQTVTHRIRRLTTTANGKPGFITYGTDTGTDDKAVVTYDQIQGKFVRSFAGVGRFFQFLKTVPGYVTCILLPFLLLLGIQALHTLRLLREYWLQQAALSRSLRETV